MSDDADDPLACGPTDHCVKWGCENAKLVKVGPHWMCPKCHSSYGSFAMPTCAEPCEVPSSGGTGRILPCGHALPCPFHPAPVGALPPTPQAPDPTMQEVNDRAVDAICGTHNPMGYPGLDALGSDFERLPTGDALREYWLARLPEGELRVLKAAADHYPDSISRDALSDVTGYKRSTRDLYVQLLARRKLVEPSREGITVRAELFD